MMASVELVRIDHRDAIICEAMLDFTMCKEQGAVITWDIEKESFHLLNGGHCHTVDSNKPCATDSGSPTGNTGRRGRGKNVE